MYSSVFSFTLTALLRLQCVVSLKIKLIQIKHLKISCKQISSTSTSWNIKLLHSNDTKPVSNNTVGILLPTVSVLSSSLCCLIRKITCAEDFFFIFCILHNFTRPKKKHNTYLDVPKNIKKWCRSVRLQCHLSSLVVMDEHDFTNHLVRVKERSVWYTSFLLSHLKLPLSPEAEQILVTHVEILRYQPVELLPSPPIIWVIQPFKLPNEASAAGPLPAVGDEIVL